MKSKTAAVIVATLATVLMGALLGTPPTSSAAGYQTDDVSVAASSDPSGSDDWPWG